MFTENLSASKIVSITDLRDQLVQSVDVPETVTQVMGDVEPVLPQTDTMAHSSVAPASTAHFTSLHTAASTSLTRPPPSTTGPGLTTRAPGGLSTEGPRPASTLVSLLQGSQAAEARAYFTGLLPGKTATPRFTASKPPTVSSSTAAAAASGFTGFTGKLGPPASDSPKYEFNAVSVTFTSSLVSL